MTKRRILGILFGFTLALGLSFGMSMTAWADPVSYDLWVGNTQVTSMNKDNVLGDGTVSFNPDTNTLTLSGVTITQKGTNNSGINYGTSGSGSLGPLTIELSAGTKNTIELGANSLAGISSVSAITIRGTGSLTSIGGWHGISGTTVTIDGGTVTATAIATGEADYDGIDGYNGVTINGGVVTATGKSQGICAGDDGITIKGGTVTASGTANNGIYSQNGNVTIENGNVKAEGPNHGIYSMLGSVIITGGTVTASGTGDGSKGVAAQNGMVQISNATVTAIGGSCGIHSGSISISNGAVTATGKNDSGGVGIYAEKNINATIEGGTVIATGGEFGINTFAIPLIIKKGATVEAVGANEGIEGKVKNEIAGAGWTDVAGTKGKTDIPASGEQGQYLEYKKVQFPTPTAKVTVAPTAKSLTYNGKAQELVTAGKAEGGSVAYALGEDATTAPADDKFIQSIPTGTEVGTYYVWYKAAGDESHFNSEVSVVSATIKTAPAPEPAPAPGPEPDPEPAPEPAPVPETAEMFRLYNPNSGEHFYTSDDAERDATVEAGWRLEGVGWTAPATGDPVYRLYNPNAGDHHYTTSADERDFLVSVGWRDEGIGWYSDTAQSMPLLRLYNPNAEAGAHHFTTSQYEHDELVNLGWRAEGIGWYGVA